jgi:hypothetical protein
LLSRAYFLPGYNADIFDTVDSDKVLNMLAEGMGIDRRKATDNLSFCVRKMVIPQALS